MPEADLLRVKNDGPCSLLEKFQSVASTGFVSGGSDVRPLRCHANMAHISQSRPGPELNTLDVALSLLGSGLGLRDESR